MYSSWFPIFLFICFFQSDPFKMTEDKIYRVKCILPFFLFPLVATSVGIVKMVMGLYGGLDVLEDMNFSMATVAFFLFPGTILAHWGEKLVKSAVAKSVLTVFILSLVCFPMLLPLIGSILPNSAFCVEWSIRELTLAVETLVSIVAYVLIIFMLRKNSVGVRT